LGASLEIGYAPYASHFLSDPTKPIQKELNIFAGVTDQYDED